jgi:hypothetical protein
MRTRFVKNALIPKIQKIDLLYLHHVASNDARGGLFEN